MTDYARAVYDYLRTLGEVGDEVPTAIHPHLMKKYDLTAKEAHKAREQAMRDLKGRGIIERVNVRGTYVKILSDFYPEPWEPGGKFVDDGLKPLG